MEDTKIAATLVVKSEETKVAVLEEKIQNLINLVGEMKDDLKEVKSSLSEKYVTREDFNFWRNIIVSLVSAALILSVGTVISLLTK